MFVDRGGKCYHRSSAGDVCRPWRRVYKHWATNIDLSKLDAD
jgi:hypothetical protein